MEICFYDISEIDDGLLKYAVIVSRYKGKWVYCKHRDRITWEIPGGHRETDERIFDTAKRELFEETGALRFDIKPICIYSVKTETESFGLLYFAEIFEFQPMLEAEIEKIAFFDYEPDSLTYPEIQPKLFLKVLEILCDVRLKNE